MTVVNILKSEFEIGYDDYRAGEKNVCFGDSGGPSFYKKNNDLYLIGITVSNELLRPFAATNVMVRTNWINAQISKYTSLYPTSIPTLIPTVTPIPPTLIPTLIPTITPVPTSAEKPYCTGNNRFCSGLNKCEDYLGGVYHENKNYKCNYNNKCCERSNITPTLNKIN